MPKYSGGSIKTALTNLSSSRGAYVPKSLGKVLGGKISHPVYGTQRVSDALKKPSIDKKTLIEIFNKAREAKGVLRETSGTKSESEFLKQVAKQEKIDSRQVKIAAQVEQKNSTVNKPVAVQNQGVKKSLPADDKKANIDLARRKTEAAERWRGVALGGEKAIRGMERVYAGGEKYRKQQAATSGLLKSRGGGGMAAEGKPAGLLNKAMQEEKDEKDEKNSSKGSKSGQKGGGTVPAGQKSGGHQAVKLQGSAGIDELTHPQEVAHENFTGGVYHVEGLGSDKPTASPPEAPPTQKSASAPEVNDLDIG